LISDPKQGDVIQGTGGLRKIRIASKGKENVAALELFITFLTTSNAAICSLFMERMRCQI
jgi:hypothetical protein